MPSIEECLARKLSVSQFREIDVVDLLGRAEVKLDMRRQMLALIAVKQFVS